MIICVFSPRVHVVELEHERLVLAVGVLRAGLVPGRQNFEQHCARSFPHFSFFKIFWSLCKVHSDEPLQWDVPGLVRHRHISEPDLKEYSSVQKN